MAYHQPTPSTKINKKLKEEQQRWLLGVTELLGISLSALAKHSNLAASTLTRNIGPKVDHCLSAKTIRKVLIGAKKLANDKNLSHELDQWLNKHQTVTHDAIEQQAFGAVMRHPELFGSMCQQIQDLGLQYGRQISTKLAVVWASDELRQIIASDSDWPEHAGMEEERQAIEAGFHARHNAISALIQSGRYGLTALPLMQP